MQIILHLDNYLSQAIALYHNYCYLLLFIIIFCETGLVVTPFLPGDSLLFMAGSFAANSYLNLPLLVLIIFTAAFAGDSCNFFIGKFIGMHLFTNPNSKIFHRQSLDRTHDFYARHGRITLVLARFLPIIRTFAPFVAGLGYMPYSKFIQFSLLATLTWSLVFLGGGYLFGNIPFIHNHLSFIILAVVILSVFPIMHMIIKEFRK